jgi:hypothetical protein
MAKWKILKRDVVIIAILMFLLGFAVGFFEGIQTALNFCIDLGFKILEKKNISIELDKELIKNEIWRYKNNLGGEDSALEDLASLRQGLR